MRKFTFSLCLCIAMLCSCVDREFDLANLSGEITVGGEQLVVPLGNLDQTTLGSLLEENENLTTNEDGVYTIAFSSFGSDPTKYEKITIDPISIPSIRIPSIDIAPMHFSLDQLPTSFNMAAISNKIVINYPEIGSAVTIAPITLASDVNLNLPISGQGELSEALAGMLPNIAFNYSNSTHFEASIDVVGQIKKVDFIEFGCDRHPYGAPFEVILDLNGITDINGGGTLTVDVVFPQAYYLRDESGNYLAQHNVLRKDIVLQPKQTSLSTIVYLHKIDYSDRDLVNGSLMINEDITYSIGLDVDVAAGRYDLSRLPQVIFKSEPEYKDLEVVIDHLELDDVHYPLSYTFEGIPDNISVEKVAFQNSPIGLKVEGLEWLEVDVNLGLTLPSCMHFKESAGFDSSNNRFVASVSELSRGVTLYLDYIDCTSPTCSLRDGKIVLDDEIVVAVDLSEMDGKALRLSQVTPKTESVAITTTISEVNLQLDMERTIIKSNSDIAFDLQFDNAPSINEVITIPSQVASIDQITICKAGDKSAPVGIDLSLKALNLPVEKVRLDAVVNLGKLLRPSAACLASGIVRKSDKGDYLVIIDEEWYPKRGALTKRLEFDALENIPQIQNGKLPLSLSFPISGAATIPGNTSLDLSSLGDITVEIDVAIDNIEVKEFTGKLDVAIETGETAISLGDISNLGVDITKLTINPILKANIKDNPTGIPFGATAKLKLYDARGAVINTIDTPNIPIAANGASNIVISTTKNAAQFIDQDVVFIAVDGLSKLLEKGIPAKIAFNMGVASDREQSFTIDLSEAAKGYKFEYQYEAVIPFEFDGEVQLAYEDEVGDLNSTFTKLASEMSGLKVGDIALLAEFGTTLPFDIKLEAELINTYGTTQGIDAKIELESNIIRGAKGDEKSVSDIVINFDLGATNSLAGLNKVDGIRFKFTLMDTGNDSASLNKNQYLEGSLKLRVRDGVTVDIFELLGMEE